jgi:putative endonuclease
MRISNPTARLGEEKARKYLLNKGYKIIETNFRDGYGEIDIITIKDNVLVFVEVKTRTSAKYGLPIEAVTKRKLNILKRTIEYYKKTHQNTPEEMRIEAISVMLDSKEAQIEHVENATYF